MRPECRLRERHRVRSCINIFWSVRFDFDDRSLLKQIHKLLHAEIGDSDLSFAVDDLVHKRFPNAGVIESMAEQGDAIMIRGQAEIV